jgi:homeobox protein Nkx-2.1
MSGNILQSSSSQGYTPISEPGDLLPELNGADLAMSLSPKHQHTTPFSVTDILSPIEESYRKLELCPSSSPYRSGGSTAGSTGSGPAPSSPSPMSNPYMHVHHQFPAQYCNTTDISYGNTTGWYGATANDPRFASEYSCFSVPSVLLVCPVTCAA